VTLTRRRLLPTLTLCLLVGSILLVVPTDLPTSDVLRTVLLLVRAAMLLVIPGLAILLWLEPITDADLLHTLPLAPIVSLALFPLLLLWVDVAGGTWNATLVRLLLLVSSLAIIWRAAQQETVTVSRASLPWLVALGGVFVLALGIRLWIIRGVLYPSCNDSYHHTLITQIILDTGAVPRGYEPYAALEQFHYHFGYHAYSAFLAWATGLPAHRAVLWGGQLLNALTVPSLFVFVNRLSRDRRAALVAAVVAALICRTPGYYVNWGRYPQLAGQVLLLPALVFAVQAARTTGCQWRPALLGGVLAGALVLTHYRVAIFYLVGILLLITTLTVYHRGQWRTWVSAILRIGILGLVAFLLVTPWLPSLLAKTADVAQQVAARGDSGQYDHFTLDFVLYMGLRLPMLITSLLATIWLVIRARRRPLGILTLTWLAITILLANPSLSGIPSGFLPNGTVIVALYLPAATLVGIATSDVYGLVRQGLREEHCGLLLVASVLLLAAAGIVGASDMITNGYDPWWSLVSDPDIPAMDWIRDNTPTEATFAVGFDFWLAEGLSGIDAGYWLPYGANRATLFPPMVYITEAPPKDVARVNALARRIAIAASASELADVLRSAGADYVYRGCRAEPDWYALVDDDAQFERVYEAGGVRIDRVR